MIFLSFSIITSPEFTHGHITHINLQRDKAWEIFPYPCVGQFRFLDLSLSRTNSYSLILSRLQNGHKLLDLGCCFAQDLRKLVYDGAPAESLIGAELKSEFLALSYNLFLDKEIFGVPLIEADVFDVDNGAPLKPLEGKLDIVQIGLFLHLFDWEDQIRACERIVALLKAEKGSLVVGQQIGSTEPGEVPKGTGGMMFKHDADSFERLWREVGEKTKSQWEVRATLDAGLGIGEKKRLWDDSKTRRLIFEVERIE